MKDTTEVYIIRIIVDVIMCVILPASVLLWALLWFGSL